MALVALFALPASATEPAASPCVGAAGSLQALATPELVASAEAADNRPSGPIGPPRSPPSNACEAQCVADFFQCQRICSRNPCLVSCEFVFDLCVANCNAG